MGHAESGANVSPSLRERDQDENHDHMLPLLDNIIQGDDDGRARERSKQQHQQQQQQQHQHQHQLRHTFGTATYASDVENNAAAAIAPARERQQLQVSRPTRRLQLARPTPFEPITDPFAFVCDIAKRPKFGHQYILCPNRQRRRPGDRIGLSVGPHWSGVLYTISIIGVITLFLVRFITTCSWCKPVTVVCSLVTVGFLLATAVADPGVVVESAEEEGAGRQFCEECSIWMPDGAEHCEECGVCIYGMDHHCPWMGKCVGRDNILWFRLFNLSWILFISFVMVYVPLKKQP